MCHTTRLNPTSELVRVCTELEALAHGFHQEDTDTDNVSVGYSELLLHLRCRILATVNDLYEHDPHL